MYADFDLSRRRIRSLAALCAFAAVGCGGHQVIDPGTVPVTQQAPVGVVAQNGENFTPAGGPIRRVPASQVVDIPDRNESAQYHKVRPGETLSGIARAHGISPARLLDSNGLESDAALQPGQLIFLPPAR